MAATPKKTSLVLAGAVAKGAFEAGVLSVLAENDVEISRIVGASAGSLNGAVYAAGICAGKEKTAAANLVELWRKHAHWHDVFKLSFSDLIAGRGASTMEKVRERLNEAKRGLDQHGHKDVELRIVVTALEGWAGKIGQADATTFERVLSFGSTHFDSAPGWEQVCDAAVASASFPGAFVVANVPGVGPCLDGGIVNNTPVQWAIEDGEIDRIIVVAATPPVVVAPAPLEGANLIGHFIDILINERLYRDLHVAASVNEKLKRLDDEVGEACRDQVKAIFGWRPIEIVQVRPAEALPGNPFSGFLDDDMLEAYVEKGRDAASAALGALSAG